jgi:hypothetical protein
MLIVGVHMNALFTSLALLELGRFIALFKQMLIVSGNLNYLGAVLAFSEHGTLLPEMQIQGFSVRKLFVLLTAELAFLIVCLGPFFGSTS